MMENIDFLKLFGTGGMTLAILGVSYKIIFFLVQKVETLYSQAMLESKEREKALMEHLDKSNDKLQSISDNQNKISENQNKIADKLTDIDGRVSDIEKTLQIQKAGG